MDALTLFRMTSILLIVFPTALWGAVGPNQRQLAHVRFWCVGGVVLGLGTGLIGLRGIAPDHVTISLANALICYGLLIKCQSLCEILNRPRISSFKLLGLAFACWLTVELARSTGFIFWPLIFYLIVLLILGIVTWYSGLIARTQHSKAARWMMVGNLIPALVLATQLLIFLMNRDLPTAVYPAQLAAIIGMAALFFAVISNFSFLGILWHRKAIEEAKELRRVERERLLREFSARLSRLDRMRSLGALAGALAHELAQPLTAILSNAELVTLSLKRSGTSTEQQVEWIQSILRNAKRGNAIVQRIRQRLQPVDSVLGRVDLNWITADVIDLMAPVLEAHQVELVQRTPDTPLVVSGDPTELSQVVVILLTNAIEASAASAVRRIEITLQAKGERALLSVRDQGHGLSDEALMSASEALFSTKPGGLGLGLEIATTIVRQHHGALSLANAPGGGALAVVDLPQAFPAKLSGT